MDKQVSKTNILTKKVTQNGVCRPKNGTITGRVWDIADTLSTTTGKPAQRKAVIDVAVFEGIKHDTASTQYGRWRKFFGVTRAAKKTTKDTQ